MLILRRATSNRRRAAVLRVLAEAPYATTTAISERIHRSEINQVLEELEADGLVVRDEQACAWTLAPRARGRA